MKQGEPLSRYLSNFVIDELLTQLTESTPGIKVDDQYTLSVQAYADAVGFVREWGMALKPRKCAAFSVEGQPITERRAC